LAAPRLRKSLKRFYDRQYLSGEKNTYYEFAATSTEGREIWLGQNVQTIEENNRIIGFQAVARDITELRRTQDALSLARDQALEASRLKSQLLAKISHELRTPLGGILGYAELLNIDAFGGLQEKQKNAVAQIIDSTNYLTKLVNELLDEAQIEAKTIKLFRDQFSPATLLSNIEASMSVLAQKKGLSITTTIDPTLPKSLYGDQQRLEQILINLVGNAIKFTSQGSIHITVDKRDETHWGIQVSDTGMGIPAEAQAYVFEPFRQVNSSNTFENRGTGLGLSITKQLVELMDGTITLDSQVGIGSTFTILLPFQQKAKE
jgi:signal transduction histidine kinase